MRMAESDKSLRQELLEARAKLQRQIEILNGVSLYDRGSGEYMQAPAQIAQLTATLQEIEDSLAELGDDDA
jgi:hypothetical protein